MAFACALFAAAIPMTAKAWTGDEIRGYDNQENASILVNEKTYFEEHIIEGRNYYYKFNTGDKDGIQLVSLESVVMNNTASGTFTAQILDRYGTVIDQATVGGPGAAYRSDAGGRALDIMFPLSGLAKNEWYYICLNANDGSAKSLEITNRLGVRYIPFLPADGFTMKYGDGNLNFSWSNVQKANTYSSLSSFDGFILELYGNGAVRYKNIGNGGATSYALSVSDPDLISLGYPSKSRVRLGCLQKYRSALEHTVTTTKCVFSNTIINTEVVKKKTDTAVAAYKYKVTKVAGDGSGTVKLLGFNDPKKTVKKVTIPASVNIKGTYYRVTEIEAKAFSGNKKITSVEIGENVKKIGNNAFNGCSALKKVTFKAGNVTTIGKTAFSGINKKATVYSPSSKIRKKYKKLLKKKITGGVKYKV